MSVKQHIAFRQLKAGALLVFDPKLLVRPQDNGVWVRPTENGSSISFEDLLLSFQEENRETVGMLLVEPGGFHRTFLGGEDPALCPVLWSATVRTDEHVFVLRILVKAFHLLELKPGVFKVFHK